MIKGDIVDKMSSLKDNEGWKYFVDKMIEKLDNLKTKLSKFNVTGDKNLSLDDIRYLQGRIWEISNIINYPQETINMLISKSDNKGEVQKNAR